MRAEKLALQGKFVRLEPLDHRHADGLVAAAAADPSLYRLSPVPQGKAEATKYIDTALSWAGAATAVPFAVVRVADESVIGSTRFWKIERWAWPDGHARQGRTAPDACEIGYTWFTSSAVRTAANTESKFLICGTLSRNGKSSEFVFMRTHATNAHGERLSESAERLRAFCGDIAWPRILFRAIPHATRLSTQSGRH